MKSKRLIGGLLVLLCLSSAVAETASRNARHDACMKMYSTTGLEYKPHTGLLARFTSPEAFSSIPENIEFCGSNLQAPRYSFCVEKFPRVTLLASYFRTVNQDNDRDRAVATAAFTQGRCGINVACNKMVAAAEACRNDGAFSRCMSSVLCNEGFRDFDKADEQAGMESIRNIRTSVNALENLYNRLEASTRTNFNLLASSIQTLGSSQAYESLLKTMNTEVSDKVKEMKELIKQLNEESKDTEKNINALKAESTKTIEKLQKDATEHKEYAEKIANDVLGKSSEIRENQARLEAVTTSLQTCQKDSTGFEMEQSELDKKIQEAKGKLQAAQATSTLLSEEIIRSRDNYNLDKASLEATKKSVQQAIQELEASIKVANKELSGLLDDIDGVQSDITRTISALKSKAADNMANENNIDSVASSALRRQARQALVISNGNDKSLTGFIHSAVNTVRSLSRASTAADIESSGENAGGDESRMMWRHHKYHFTDFRFKSHDDTDTEQPADNINEGEAQDGADLTPQPEEEDEEEDEEDAGTQTDDESDAEYISHGGPTKAVRRRVKARLQRISDLLNSLLESIIDRKIRLVSSKNFLASTNSQVQVVQDNIEEQQVRNMGLTSDLERLSREHDTLAQQTERLLGDYSLMQTQFAHQIAQQNTLLSTAREVVAVKETELKGVSENLQSLLDTIPQTDKLSGQCKQARKELSDMVAKLKGEISKADEDFEAVSKKIESDKVLKEQIVSDIAGLNKIESEIIHLEANQRDLTHELTDIDYHIEVFGEYKEQLAALQSGAYTSLHSRSQNSQKQQQLISSYEEKLASMSDLQNQKGALQRKLQRN